MEKFEPHVLISACEKCLGQNSTVFTDHYLCIFSEVKKLFTEWGLGAAFKDSEKAVKKLEIRRVTGARYYYRELQPLLCHEREVGESSGIKAFVVLHRVTAFAVHFLQALQTAVEEEKKFQAKLRLQAYSDSLAPHQPGLTQSAVKLALVGVAGRRGLLAKLQDHCHGEMSANQALRDISTKLQLVHNAVEGILKDEVSTKTGRDSSVPSSHVGIVENGHAGGFAMAD